MLHVENLSVAYRTSRGLVHAVDDVSFRIRPGRTLALVGESGSGKSTTALAILDLLPKRQSVISADGIVFDGLDLAGADAKRLDAIRGPRIGMVFQDALTSLNPSLTIGSQITETLRRHGIARGADARTRMLELLAEVQLPDPARVAGSYAHQLSGGMRQRALIALGLCCDPQLLIADEPTTALDVTIQAEILRLLKRLRDDREMSMLLITHDLGVASEIADDVAVMYAGEIVELGPTARVLGEPAHPYTRALLGALPSMDAESPRRARLTTIPGSPPDLVAPPPGDRFAARIDPDSAAPPGTPSPDLVEVAPHHFARVVRSSHHVPAL